MTFYNGKLKVSISCNEQCIDWYKLPQIMCTMKGYNAIQFVSHYEFF